MQQVGVGSSGDATTTPCGLLALSSAAGAETQKGCDSDDEGDENGDVGGKSTLASIFGGGIAANAARATSSTPNGCAKAALSAPRTKQGAGAGANAAANVAGASGGGLQKIRRRMKQCPPGRKKLYTRMPSSMAAHGGSWARLLIPPRRRRRP